MVAIGAMSPTVEALFFGAALVCLVLDAVGVATRVRLLPLGVAFAVVPFFWDALARA